MTDQRTYKIIGAAMEVHKELGCEFLEAVYQEALEWEFVDQKIPFKAQPVVQIFYKGNPLDKTYQPDFICYDEVIAEIKAVSSLSGTEKAQLINYLKATSRDHCITPLSGNYELLGAPIRAKRTARASGQILNCLRPLGRV